MDVYLSLLLLAGLCIASDYLAIYIYNRLIEEGFDGRPLGFIIMLCLLFINVFLIHLLCTVSASL